MRDPGRSSSRESGRNYYVAHLFFIQHTYSFCSMSMLNCLYVCVCMLVFMDIYIYMYFV